jgi:hypothetical protein
LTLGGDQQVELEPIKIPLLAGDIAPIDLMVIDFRARNAIIGTRRHWKAINDVY